MSFLRFLKKHPLRVALSLSLFSVLGLIAAGLVPDFANAYSHTVYFFLSHTAALLSGLFPFSLAELGLYLLLLFLLSGLSRAVFLVFRRKSPRPLLRFLTHCLLLFSVLFFLYVFQCGINYQRDSFSMEAGIPLRPHTKKELLSVCERLLEELQSAGIENSPRQADAAFLRSAGKIGQRAMEQLGAEYPRLAGKYPPPKPLLVSRILTVQQLTGVYSPFTMEANFNREMPRYDIPFTICHELSHLRGYMQEQEANFIAFLACRSSEDPYFRYSGSLSAFIYCGNALASVDPEAYRSLYAALPEQARQDLSYGSGFWAAFEGPVSEAANQVNDSYLKMNGQSEGVQSYGRVVDLILEYYLAF